MPKIISIASFKGGVGKTITTFNIASILAEQGYKVLCLDLDPQGNLTRNFNIDRSSSLLKGVEMIFTQDNQYNLNDLIIKAPIKELKTLDVVASTIWLHQSEFNLALASAREFKLKYFLEDNLFYLKQYDYVLMDTSPSMSYLNQNAFAISNKILIAATPDQSDIDGIHLFCALWDNIRHQLRIPDNISAVVITRFDKRNSLDKNFVNFIHNNENTKDIASILLETIIPTNVTLKNSANANKPINIYDKKSSGYFAYNELVKELLKKGDL